MSTVAVLGTRWLSELLLQRIPAEDRWVLYGPLKLYSKRLKRILLVPPGFETDFASIPRVFWRVLPKNGKWDGAAVLHDAAYRRVLSMTKEEADLLFRDVMELDGVSRWQRTLLYQAVKRFGQGAWDQGGQNARVAQDGDRGTRERG